MRADQPATPRSRRSLDGAVCVVAAASESQRIVRLLGPRRTVRCAGLAALARHRRRSAVILGAEQRDDSQLTMLRALAAQEPRVPLLAVAALGDAREVRSLLAAGASGVVANRELAATLAPCLRAILAGQSCVPGAQAAQLTPAPLSAREKQILGMVVMGCMNSEIAQRLFLAESTVKSHLHSAFGKLGVRSRNEAVNAILDPARGLGPGILTIASEPVASA